MELIIIPYEDADNVRPSALSNALLDPLGLWGPRYASPHAASNSCILTPPTFICPRNGFVALLSSSQPRAISQAFIQDTAHSRFVETGTRRKSRMSAYPKTTKITDLKIYPIKSCRGFSVKTSTLTRQGLKHDRCCMFIDANSKFITIRDKPEMTLIKTNIDHDNAGKAVLKVTFPAITKTGGQDPQPNYENATTIFVPLEADQDWLSENAELIEAEIWEYQTDAYAFTAPEITNVVTNYFTSWDPEANVRLVSKGPTPRECRGNGSKELLGRQETVNFPDVLPIQVATETSLRELNSRLKANGAGEITYERFRPNVIVDSENLQPWEEDEWKTLRINPPKSLMGSLSTMTGFGNESTDIDVVARCARCQVPNVDPDTAVKNKKEPWTTLVSYRRVDEGVKYKPCYGMLCCPRTEGAIEVGMEMEIREVMQAAGGKGEHRYVKGF